ncbi:MAG: hypothetical protein AAFQ10_03420 [Pseudomonadota bacterium]
MRDPLIELVERIAELERRQANFMRPVTVTKNNEDGTVTVSDGKGFDPKPVRQMSVTAGDWHLDAPAAEGTQGFLLCPEGDPSQGEFLPCMASDDKPRTSADPQVLKLRGPEGIELTITGGVMTFTGKMELGGAGGPLVARKGDKVICPAGEGVIVEGSSQVTCVD